MVEARQEKTATDDDAIADGATSNGPAGTQPKGGEQPVRKQLHDQKGDGGYDELVFHRSFSRPKLVSEGDDNKDIADVAELSDGIKLRLFIARMRALEAHALAQVADADGDLSDTIKQNLADARMKAVQAHQKKFG